MSVDDLYLWSDGGLTIADPAAATEPSADGAVLAADSWLVVDGRVRALALHKDRFFNAVRASGWVQAPDLDDLTAFWDAAVAVLPRQGQWFPRVELRANTDGNSLRLLVRGAPEVTRSVTVATTQDGDPREQPRIKGPDLERLAHARAAVAPVGAGEAIILTPDGFVVEGAYSGLLWWRGSILCAPLDEFDRVDSVTVRSILALATAMGIETYREAVTPAELDGTELWSLSALHGARIVTQWVDGPSLAELPGRLATWQARLGALRQTL